MDVIILTGGKGTRLRSKIKDIPKTMADVNGKPFLEWTLEWLSKFNVKNVILAVGYKKEYIKEYFGDKYQNIKIIYSEEDEPLGTVGVVKFENDRITKFEEKKYVEKGFMNTGVYVINRNIFDNKINQDSFSIENDYLNKYVASDKISPFIYDGQFVDIGIPEDYEKIKEIIE